MSSISLIATCSILVAVLPALGFPRSWEEIFFVLLGLLSFSLALSLRHKEKSAHLEQEAPLTASVERGEHSSISSL